MKENEMIKKALCQLLQGEVETILKNENWKDIINDLISHVYSYADVQINPNEVKNMRIIKGPVKIEILSVPSEETKEFAWLYPSIDSRISKNQTIILFNYGETLYMTGFYHNGLTILLTETNDYELHDDCAILNKLYSKYKAVMVNKLGDIRTEIGAGVPAIESMKIIY